MHSGPASEPWKSQCASRQCAPFNSCSIAIAWIGYFIATRASLHSPSSQLCTFDFLAFVDLPRVNPQEVLQEVEKFLIANGITEFWHMEGITMNAFKRDSFKDAFMIGLSLPPLLV